MKPGQLYLVPNFLGEEGSEKSLPFEVVNKIHTLTYFIAEKAKTARAFLKKINHPIPLPQIQIEEFNNKTDVSEIPELIHPLLAGENTGLISEAGNPCIADPGALIVKAAHQNNARVIPLIGASSILLALIASGMNGQNFTFHGYLPIDEMPRKKATQKMILNAKSGYTQLFMETPYRNLKTLESILNQIPKEMCLTIAANITQPSEFIQTKTASEWRKSLPNIHKVPAIFVLGY